MKSSIIMIAALALFVAAPVAIAQDKDLTEAIEALTNAMEAKSKDLSIDLKKEVTALKDLLDVDTMEEEVNDLIDLNRSEKKTVRSALESFRAHWVRRDAGDEEEDSITINTSEDSGWLEKIIKKASAVLDDEDGAAFKIWLLAHKGKVDKAIEKIGAVAGELGARMGELGGRVGDLAGRISADAVRLGLHSAERASKLHEILEPRLEALKALKSLHGAEWGEWAEDLTRDLEGIGTGTGESSALAAVNLSERIRKQISEALDRDALKNLHKLSRIHEGDWDDFSDRINAIVKESISGLDNLGLAEESFHDALEDYSVNVRKATEQFRKALELQRGKWDHKTDEHRKAIHKYLYRYYGDYIKDKAQEKTRIDELRRKTESIDSRDSEIRELREEIDALKRQLKKMKKEKAEQV